MKGDHETDRSTSQSQYGQEQIPPQGSSTKAYDPPSAAGYDDQAPPGYVAVVDSATYNDRQPLIGAGNHAVSTPQAGEQTDFVMDSPRQADADLIIDILLYVVALAIPPAAVVVKRGCGPQFWLNVVLTIFGGIPGLLHAWYIIAITPGTIRAQAHRDGSGAPGDEHRREEAGIQI